MKRAGVLAGVVAVAGLGAAVGIGAEKRAIQRLRSAEDPEAARDFFTTHPDRTRRVIADDGVPLYVEEDGASDAPLTIVFCHGYTEQLALWHYQRSGLADLGRLVLWDQRSHGRSGRSSAEHSTIDQLGSDLLSVLEDCAPTGPVVLIGHSMGGMTIMALADQHPELFGDRVVGVGLVSTSTGKLASVTFGLPASFTSVTARLLPLLTKQMRGHRDFFESGRKVGTDFAYATTMRIAFGSREVPPTVVEFVEQMIAKTPVDVIAEFYDTFMSHDKLSALKALNGIPTLVIVGSKDVLTPVDHSRAMANALPDAELVIVDGAGHLLPVEQPAGVNLQLRALINRATT